MTVSIGPVACRRQWSGGPVRAVDLRGTGSSFGSSGFFALFWLLAERTVGCVGPPLASKVQSRCRLGVGQRQRQQQLPGSRLAQALPERTAKLRSQLMRRTPVGLLQTQPLPGPLVNLQVNARPTGARPVASDAHQSYQGRFPRGRRAERSGNGESLLSFSFHRPPGPVGGSLALRSILYSRQSRRSRSFRRQQSAVDRRIAPCSPSSRAGGSGHSDIAPWTPARRSRVASGLRPCDGSGEPARCSNGEMRSSQRRRGSPSSSGRGS